MSRTFFVGLAALFTLANIVPAETAWAAPNWQPFDSDPKTAGPNPTLFDLDSVVTTPDTVSFWIKSKRGYYDLEKVQRLLISCSQRTTQIQAGIIYDAQGRELKSDLNVRAPSSLIAPGTALDAFREAYCDPEINKLYRR